MTTVSSLYPRDKAIDEMRAALDRLRQISSEHDARSVQGRLVAVLELATKARELSENMLETLAQRKAARMPIDIAAHERPLERIWVGPRYSTSRILVLGESWYGEYEGDLVTDDGYISAYLAGKQTDRMYTRMANAAGLEKGEFWHAVAFTNFVQRVGDTRRCRPTRAQYVEAQPRLSNILLKYQPKGVWILGKEQSVYSQPVVRAAGISCAVSPHPTSRGVSNEQLGEGWRQLIASIPRSDNL
jgi:hypothetical protein